MTAARPVSPAPGSAGTERRLGQLRLPQSRLSSVRGKQGERRRTAPLGDGLRRTPPRLRARSSARGRPARRPSPPLTAPHRLASPSGPGSVRRRPVFLRTIAPCPSHRRRSPGEIWRATTNSRERAKRPPPNREARRAAPRPAERLSQRAHEGRWPDRDSGKSVRTRARRMAGSAPGRNAGRGGAGNGRPSPRPSPPEAGAGTRAAAEQGRRWLRLRPSCGPGRGSGRCRRGRSPSTCASCGSTRCSPRRPPGLHGAAAEGVPGRGAARSSAGLGDAAPETRSLRKARPRVPHKALDWPEAPCRRVCAFGSDRSLPGSPTKGRHQTRGSGPLPWRSSPKGAWERAGGPRPALPGG